MHIEQVKPSIPQPEIAEQKDTLSEVEFFPEQKKEKLEKEIRSDKAKLWELNKKIYKVKRDYFEKDGKEQDAVDIQRLEVFLLTMK